LIAIFIFLFTHNIFAMNEDSLNSLQTDHLRLCVHKSLKPQSGVILTIGACNTAIEEFTKLYQYRSVQIISLHFRDKKNWPTLLTELKDRECDCFYVANALEVIPNHNEFLQDLLRCLKPKGTGVFCVNPSELTTLDTELVEFIELTDWKTTVNPPALLSIETYRDLLVNNGFLITDEFEWLFNFFHYNYAMDWWICDRFDVIDFDTRKLFAAEFKSFINENYPCIFKRGFDPYLFLVKKL
ncbi:MAG: hypothetical protein KGI80_05860, partial [Verrucomicrobiota bacterium]|nr:hypothetical protein [Verrucomicrobiota bacterium]